ncbi:MAG: DUF4363 family protein [Clostridia bacterium]|nr:DUF4363 family protein [Clostridia bacterium]
MKAFIVSLVVLVLVSGVIIGNAIYVDKTLGQISQGAEELLPESEDEFLQIYNDWEKNRSYIAISAPHGKIDDVDMTMTIMKELYENDSFLNFYEYKATLIEYIEEIQNHERLSFDSIF